MFFYSPRTSSSSIMFISSSHIDLVPYPVEFHVFPRLQSFFFPLKSYKKVLNKVLYIQNRANTRRVHGQRSDWSEIMIDKVNPKFNG